ncbi:hypothetical protein [Algicella marina]|uniref:Flagellar assembly protein FliH/Type III secretion system HrpE domain-containing protein n=1 Tax=Algicella marina TaxID=2683284 RepID=A0A6P1T1L2_9RHOB|nr:hypothetical protein [Algicella marina]QHQ36804.1 hypothetical protein GO499_17270 [Algicella marina]
MSRVQLEVFSPGSEAAMAKRENLAQKVAEAYREGQARGFAQGAEQSAREHAEAQDQLRLQFIEALRDAQLQQVAAQQHVLQSVFPLIETFLKTLAPHLAEAGLLHEVESRLRDVLASRPDLEPVITCAPELESGIRTTLTGMSGEFTLRPDPRLTPLEARLAWDDGFDRIDFTSCLEAITLQIDEFRSVTAETPTKEEQLDVG